MFCCICEVLDLGRFTIRKFGVSANRSLVFFTYARPADDIWSIRHARSAADTGVGRARARRPRPPVLRLPVGESCGPRQFGRPAGAAFFVSAQRGFQRLGLVHILGRHRLTSAAFLYIHVPELGGDMEYGADCDMVDDGWKPRIWDGAFGTAIYMTNLPEFMKAEAEKHGFSFPYLYDESQSVARAYGAECTPDFFGYNAEGKLQYRGRLDASGRQPGPPDAKRELFEAMILIDADQIALVPHKVIRSAIASSDEGVEEHH